MNYNNPTMHTGVIEGLWNKSENPTKSDIRDNFMEIIKQATYNPTSLILLEYIL